MKTRYYISYNKNIFGCGWSNYDIGLSKDMQEVNWLSYWLYRLSRGKLVYIWTLSKEE